MPYDGFVYFKNFRTIVSTYVVELYTVLIPYSRLKMNIKKILKFYIW